MPVLKTKTENGRIEEIEIRIIKREKGKAIPIEPNSEEFDRIIDVVVTTLERGLCLPELGETVEYRCEYMEWTLRCRPIVPISPLSLLGATDEEIEELFGRRAYCTFTNGKTTYEFVVL